MCETRLQLNFTAGFMQNITAEYLEEGALGLQCAGEVVGVGAAEAVAATRCSSLLTVSAA